MRYHILATDYDGTIADNGKVFPDIIEALQLVKTSGRMLVLVTGRELDELKLVFPGYELFDYIVAENGALIHFTKTGQDTLLGDPPSAVFVNALQQAGVRPMSVGKVIVATWEPHEKAVLNVIKELGIEQQVIFNKGAVMILPPGVNKATGLQALLQLLNFSLHNVVAVGDAENDHAMLQAAECGVAVANALPALKETADMVTVADHGYGVAELVQQLVENDLAAMGPRLQRTHLELGTLPDDKPFLLQPYRSGILVSGLSGSGKSTLAITFVESLVKRGYLFCLVDPEGDFLELQMEGVSVIGNETTMPDIQSIRDIFKQQQQSFVICLLSVPRSERAAYTSGLLAILQDIRKQYGHPHWIILDEAHHLFPVHMDVDAYPISPGFNNFMLISIAPDAISPGILARTGMLITTGDNTLYPFEQYCAAIHKPVPHTLPMPAKNEACVWEVESEQLPFIIRTHMPSQLLQRHRRKYAAGDMDYNSFFFTGPANALHLKAQNLLMFKHIAAGIDDVTWLYHLQRNDFANWFRNSVHDEELAAVSEEAQQYMDNPEQSKKMILDCIDRNYR